MTIAEALHAFVSFICMEDTKKGSSSSKIQNKSSSKQGVDERLSPREMLFKAETIVDCLTIYQSSNIDTATEDRILDKMKTIAKTFNNWFVIYNGVSPHKEISKYALAEMKNLASTFEEWRAIYDLGPGTNLQEESLDRLQAVANDLDELESLHGLTKDQSYREKVLMRMALIAKTIEEKVRVYDIAKEGDPIRDAILRDLKLTTRSFEDWEKVIDQSDEGSALEHFAAERMVELAPDKLSNLADLLTYDVISQDDRLQSLVINRIKQTERPFDEIKEVFKESEDGSDLERLIAPMLVEKVPNDSKALSELLDFTFIYDDSTLQEIVLSKLRHSSASFDVWKEIHDDDCYDEVEEITIIKMIETASSLDELLEVAEMTDGEDDENVNTKFVEKFNACFASREDNCRKILEDYSEDHVLCEAALKGLLTIFQTIEQCLAFYFETDFEDEHNDLILERIFSLATKGECIILSLVAEEGSSLREWAEERVSRGK